MHLVPRFACDEPPSSLPASLPPSSLPPFSLLPPHSLVSFFTSGEHTLPPTFRRLSHTCRLHPPPLHCSPRYKPALVCLTACPFSTNHTPDTDVHVACLTCYGAMMSTSPPLPEVQQWLGEREGGPWLVEHCVTLVKGEGEQTALSTHLLAPHHL